VGLEPKFDFGSARSTLVRDRPRLSYEARTESNLYANLLKDMGELARCQEQYTDAIAYFKKALDVHVRHDPFDEIWGTLIVVPLGLCYLSTGQEDEAAEEIRKAFQTRVAILGETHPHTLVSLCGPGTRIYEHESTAHGYREYREGKEDKGTGV
jgi:tetratricopeptide (TPR) repeat protein